MTFSFLFYEKIRPLTVSAAWSCQLFVCCGCSVKLFHCIIQRFFYVGSVSDILPCLVKSCGLFAEYRRYCTGYCSVCRFIGCNLHIFGSIRVISYLVLLVDTAWNVAVDL